MDVTSSLSPFIGPIAWIYMIINGFYIVVVAFYRPHRMDLYDYQWILHRCCRLYRPHRMDLYDYQWILYRPHRMDLYDYQWIVHRCAM